METSFTSECSTPGRGWKRPILLILLTAVVLLILLIVLNPQNPAYEQSERQALEAEAVTIRSTGEITGPRWNKLIGSASTECHFKSQQPQEYLISGILPDVYIQPNTQAIRWYIRFPANRSYTLFGTSGVQVGILTVQQFYGLVKKEGFQACTPQQAANARALLSLP